MANMIKLIAFATALSLVALTGFSGCGSEAGPGQAQPAVDGGSASDSAGSADNDDGADGTPNDAGSTADTVGGGGGAADVAAGGSDTGSTDVAPSNADAGDPCDKCTADQVCVAGKCIGEDPCDGKCLDGQLCVDGQCVEKPKPCGGPCAKGQVCDITADGGKGKCISPTCKLPDTWSPNLQKVAMMTLLPASKGCDLDNDAVPNNSLGAVSELIGKSFGDSFKNGGVIMILEATKWMTDETPFNINVLQGELDSSSSDCDLVNSSCNYQITPSSYDPATPGTGLCAPVSVFEGVKIKGDAMAAGGPKQVFNMVLGLAGVGFKVPVKGATLSAKVTDAKGWKTLTDGLLCGVVLKKDLEDAIDKVPDGELQPVGGKATVKSLLNTLVIPDIDTNDDGTKDGISAALTLTGVGAVIKGLSKAP